MIMMADNIHTAIKGPKQSWELKITLSFTDFWIL